MDALPLTPILDGLIQKHCTKCEGNCCIRTTPTPINRFSWDTYFETLPVEFKEDGVTCKFLQENHQCSIYSRRSLICRIYPLYPYLNQLLSTKSIQLGLSGKCSYAQQILDEFSQGNEDLKTEIQSLDEFFKTNLSTQEYLDEMATKSNYNLIINLIAN